jgi:hypothetical protein
MSDSTFYGVHVVKAIYEIMRYAVVSSYRPVSYPGDPIAKPLIRRGKWKKSPTESPVGWKFASDDESHAVSKKQYPTVKLSGTSAGRQIWYKDGMEESPSVATTDRPTFSASENPNSGDKLLRNIMIAKWQGPIPDDKSNP